MKKKSDYIDLYYEYDISDESTYGNDRCYGRLRAALKAAEAEKTLNLAS